MWKPSRPLGIYPPLTEAVISASAEVPILRCRPPPNRGWTAGQRTCAGKVALWRRIFVMTSAPPTPNLRAFKDARPDLYDRGVALWETQACVNELAWHPDDALTVVKV